jgi:hypothetical protein
VKANPGSPPIWFSPFRLTPCGKKWKAYGGFCFPSLSASRLNPRFRSGKDAVNATITTMKTATLPPTTEAAIWARVIHPNGVLTLAVARAILQLEFSDDDQERMHELSQKAQEGALTPEEQFEIDNFERVGNLLAIWKSQSRKLLKRVPRRRS